VSTCLSIIYVPRFRVVRRCLIVACWLAAFAVAVPAWASDEKPAAAGEGRQLAFAILPQPLDLALDAYSATTHVHILYDSSLASGRMSDGVTGKFTPEAALQTLLKGTGLAVRYTTSKDIVLMPQAPEDAPPGPAAAAVEGTLLSLDTLQVEGGSEIGGGADYRLYAGIVQADIQAALHQDSRTRSGSYSIGVKLWVDHSGAILRSEIFRSSGDTERDTLISYALRSVTISKAPPPNMPQPVSVMIVARSW
jgi:Secretin and TonB N terminus short domain/TonB C terminal